MEINGYTLSLANGNLQVRLGDKLIMATKGDPRKKGNPAFATLEEASEYFKTTGYATPNEEAPVEEAPVDPTEV